MDMFGILMSIREGTVKMKRLGASGTPAKLTKQPGWSSEQVGKKYKQWHFQITF